MKDLDKECTELNRELVEVETAYLDNRQALHKRKLEDRDYVATEAETQTLVRSMERIQSLRVTTKQKLSEKSAIAVNMGNIIDRFSKKLDTDLAFFETDLKGCGEFDTNKGAEPGSEVNAYCLFCLILLEET